MPTNIPIMPIVFIVLLVLPIKLAPQRLKLLAFAIWMIGGLVLSSLGYQRLMDPTNTLTNGVYITLALAAVIGVVKGKFVLGKTVKKNIARIDSMTEPHKPINVYSKASWIVISVMVLIAVSLNSGWIPVNLAIRGAINIGIGLALIVSSFGYLGSLQCCNEKPTNAA